MPPEEAHTPIEMTHFGLAIWSYTWRSTGAIFWLTRPATIIRSAWRGEPRKTSIPKRLRSKLAAPVAIISMAQQARPKLAGHTLLRRAHLTRSSSRAVRKLWLRSSRPMRLPDLDRLPLRLRRRRLCWFCPGLPANRRRGRASALGQGLGPGPGVLAGSPVEVAVDVQVHERHEHGDGDEH